MTAIAMSKIKKHLLAGKILELQSADNAILRVRRGPSQHSTTKAEGCVLSVVLVGSPDSVTSSTVNVQAQIFLARSTMGHDTIPSFRRFRIVNNDPLGIETSETAMTVIPSAWNMVKRAVTLASGALLSKYCLTIFRYSPMLSKTCFVLAGGLVASSMGYTSDWAKDKIHDSIWDFGLYCFSLGITIVLHPIVLFILMTWFVFKVASYGPGDSKVSDWENDDDDLDPTSGTEPPSEPETSLCEAYRVQLLRDRYRLLSDKKCRTLHVETANVSEFDSVARFINGHEVSVSLPGVSLCRTHQRAYLDHVEENTCSTLDCMDRGYLNCDGRDQPVVECMQHMKLRIKSEGVGKGALYAEDDNISIASSRKKHSKKTRSSKKITRVSSKSESSELEDDDHDIPSLTKQLNDVRPGDLFSQRRKSADSVDNGLWQTSRSSSEEGELTGRSRLSMPDLAQPAGRKN